jgi:lysophospholipase L1-like esterase
MTFVGRESGGPNDVEGVPFPKNHEGYSGWFVDQFIAQKAQGAIDANIPHIFLIMMGTNDIHQESNASWSDGEQTAAELSDLIDIFVDRVPDALVVVAQIVPMTLSYGNVQANLQDYNNRIPGLVEEKASQGKHVIVVDLNTEFPANGLGDDGLHPSNDGYVFMGNKWYEAIKDYLP